MNDLHARRLLVALLIAALALMAMIVRPFWEALFLAAVLAAALRPVMEWLARHLGGRRSLAAAIVTLTLLIVVVLPLAGLAAILVGQVSDGIQWLRGTIESEGVWGLVERLPPRGPARDAGAARAHAAAAAAAPEPRGPAGRAGGGGGRGRHRRDRDDRLPDGDDAHRLLLLPDGRRAARGLGGRAASRSAGASSACWRRTSARRASRCCSRRWGRRRSRRPWRSSGTSSPARRTRSSSSSSRSSWRSSRRWGARAS